MARRWAAGRRSINDALRVTRESMNSLNSDTPSFARCLNAVSKASNDAMQKSAPYFEIQRLTAIRRLLTPEKELRRA
jgi:hypothetical protein